MALVPIWPGACTPSFCDLVRRQRRDIHISPSTRKPERWLANSQAGRLGWQAGPPHGFLLWASALGREGRAMGRGAGPPRDPDVYTGETGLGRGEHRKIW